MLHMNSSMQGESEVHHPSEAAHGFHLNTIGLAWQVVQAFLVSKAAYRSRDACFGESALPMMRLQGTPDTWVDISWQKTNSVAYLAFRVRESDALSSMHALGLYTMCSGMQEFPLGSFSSLAPSIISLGAQCLVFCP